MASHPAAPGLILGLNFNYILDVFEINQWHLGCGQLKYVDETHIACTTTKRNSFLGVPNEG